MPMRIEGTLRNCRYGSPDCSRSVSSSWMVKSCTGPIAIMVNLPHGQCERITRRPHEWGRLVILSHCPWGRFTMIAMGPVQDFTIHELLTEREQSGDPYLQFLKVPSMRMGIYA